MAITACTTSPYTVNLVGYVPGVGTAAGSVVTFNTPRPVWTEAEYSGPSDIALQCGAVTIGGFNGLNS